MTLPDKTKTLTDKTKTLPDKTTTLQKEGRMTLTFAYLRCSDVSQNLDRQYTAIRNYKNIPEQNMFADKKSGKTDEREQYQAMKVLLQNLADINRRRDKQNQDIIEVVVEELDRLGRSASLIRKELEWFKNRGIVLRVLELPTTLIDISSENWVLDMVNQILIEVYTALAEQELVKKEKRQREGIEEAKKRGVYKGRKPIAMPDNFIEVYERWKNKEITARRAMEVLNLKPNTFYRMVATYKEKHTK